MLVFRCFWFLVLVASVTSKSRYIQPVNTGMTMGVPTNIANIFNKRPIAGVISVSLSIGLALILFFSVITSPFGYFFGVPSRQYVMGGQPPTEPTLARSIGQIPDFGRDPFWLLPREVSDRSCQLFILCYAHGALGHLDPKATKVYNFFSKNFVNVQPDFAEAIVVGFEDNGQCATRYSSCDKSVFSILVNTIIQLLPARARRRTESTMFT